MLTRCKNAWRSTEELGIGHHPVTTKTIIQPLPPIVCLFLPSDFLRLDVVPFRSLVHVMERFSFGHYLLTVCACFHLSND